MTSNFCKEFDKDYTGMLASTGRTLIQRNIQTFNVNPFQVYNFFYLRNITKQSRIKRNKTIRLEDRDLNRAPFFLRSATLRSFLITFKTSQVIATITSRNPCYLSIRSLTKRNLSYVQPKEAGNFRRL
jgi:hypothetical protein